MKYYKTGVFVLNFAKFKIAEQSRSGFRNLELRIVAILRETQFWWFVERKSNFSLVSSKEPTQSMVQVADHLLFRYSQNVIR